MYDQHKYISRAATLLFFIWVALKFVKAVDPVDLQVFQYAYYQGDSRTFTIQECGYFSWIGTRVASAKIHRGTCIKLYKSNNCKSVDCGGTVCSLAYPHVAQPVLNESIYHNLNSAEPCATEVRNTACPNGTWVKRMDFSVDDLRSGITIYCYEPTSDKPKVIINTHGKHLSTYSSQYCQGATRAIRILKNNTYNFISKAEAECKYNADIGADTLQCDKTDALVGVSVVVEEISNVIKSLKPICRYVQDPVKLCTPTDAFQPIVVCDNNLGFTDTSCQYSKTVGVGISKSLTTALSLSLNFYGEFGFGGSAGQALSATFAAKLGLSVTTKFDWTKAVATTWNEQTTVTVSVTTPPKVITRLEQVVGTCSFYDVHTTFFRRVDTHGNASTTLLVIDEDLLKLDDLSKVN